MKTKLTSLICAVSISTVAISQDVITFKNGNEKKVKVLEVSPSEVKYKSFDNVEGPTYSDQKSTIFMIKYENGLKDIFNAETTEPTKISEAEPILVTQTYSYISRDHFHPDLIIKTNGDSIKCVIDLASTTIIKYHITRQGMDTRISIPMNEVKKFYNNSKTKNEVFTIVEVPKIIEVPQKAEDPDADDIMVQEARKYGGPRVGVTLVGPGAYRDLLNYEGKRNIYSQFGWQFEKRMFTTKTGISGMVEFVPMIGGIDMGKFIPSISALIGVRTKKGIEVGVGPNAAVYGVKNAQGYYKTSTSFGIVIAAGMSFKSDKVYFPVNLAFIPSVGKTANVVQPDGTTKREKYQTGAKISLLVGFNYRKK